MAGVSQSELSAPIVAHLPRFVRSARQCRRQLVHSVLDHFGGADLALRLPHRASLLPLDPTHHRPSRQAPSSGAWRGCRLAGSDASSGSVHWSHCAASSGDPPSMGGDHNEAECHDIPQLHRHLHHSESRIAWPPPRRQPSLRAGVTARGCGLSTRLSAKRTAVHARTRQAAPALHRAQ